MKKIFILISLLLIVNNLLASEKKFIIEGNITNIPDSITIGLYADWNQSIDSAMIIGGKFRLEGKSNAAIPIKYLLRSRDLHGCCEIWVYNNTTKITGNSDIIIIWDVKSDLKEQKELNRYITTSKKELAELQPYETQKSKLYKEYSIATNAHDTIKMAEIDKMMKPILKKIKSLEQTIQRNDIKIMQETDVSLVWMDRLLIMSYQAEYDSLICMASQALYDKMSDKQKVSETGKEIKKYLFPEKIKAGDKMIDIELVDFDDNKHLVSEELKDRKYILLDFWSSDCAPCIDAIPDTRKTVEEYKDILKIIGIYGGEKESFDRIAKSKGGITWQTYLLTTTTWDKYKLHAVPSYFLISPEGVVIDTWIGYCKECLSKKLTEYGIKE